jgi:stage II sporulation protein GA (sporulation sigma-E factor processing peptidase)
MFAKRSAPENKVISVTLIKNGRAVSVNALLDTGNTLKDAFTGNGVAVADEAVIRNLLGFSLDTYISREKAGLYNSERLNIRLIPVTTVSSEALLPAVKVDEIILNNTNTAVKNLLVAQSKSKIKNGEYQLILSSEIINEVENNDKRTTEKTAFKN